VWPRFLDGFASSVGGEEGWLASTARLSQADITSAVAYTFTNAVRPHLDLAAEVPHLARFTARCEALAMFRNAPLPESIS
jgi:glutathione S-transferase